MNEIKKQKLNEITVTHLQSEQASEDGSEYECSGVLTHHSQDVKQVLWHPSMELLVSASYDNKINLYCQDDDDWTLHQSLTGHDNTVWAISFDSTGEWEIPVD